MLPLPAGDLGGSKRDLFQISFQIYIQIYIYVSYSWPNGLTFFRRLMSTLEKLSHKNIFFFFKIQLVNYKKLIPNLSEKMGRTNCCCFAIRVHFFKESSEAGHHRTPLYSAIGIQNYYLSAVVI